MSYRIITVFLALVLLFSCSGHNDKLYDELETCLAKRQELTKAKEEKIADLKVELNKCKDEQGRFALCDSLVKHYYLFNSDSASKYIDLEMKLAVSLNRADYINKVRILDAYILATSGHYNDAETTMQNVDTAALDKKNLRLYYETWRWIYNTWEAYVKDEARSDIYAKKADAYLDTLCMIEPGNTANGLYFKAEKQWNLGNLKEAEKNYLACISKLDKSERIYASACCALAMVYDMQERYDDYEHYMILAAISDQSIPLKENLALQELAEYLSHHKMEYNQAQRYLVYSVEDAIYYNNRLRLTEIARKLPDIALGYQKAEDTIAKYNLTVIAIMGALALGLLVVVMYSLKQNKKLIAQRKDRIILNEKLKATNISRDKYVSLFIDLCAVAIDKYNNLTKTIERKVKAHQVDDLLVLLNNNRLKDKDVKEVLLTFDRAFLNLYPKFVDEFNLLLQPDHRIQLKEGQLLNSELRIMAFVRMGMKDTNRIATLLNYSAQTIYNYRSTLKNHAIDKDNFEDNVAKLCEFN